MFTAETFRILLVDDFELVRLMLRNGLRDLGLNNISEAASGKEALKLVREAAAENKPFHVVFCDWNMPEMSGMDVLASFRATPELAALPFIMVTAESEQKQVFKALTAGATDYIIKPFSPSTIEAKLRRILEKIQQAKVA